MSHIVKSEKSVAKLRERLEAIAGLMEASTHYSPMEVYAWRLIAAFVDQDHFDRTGQIITTPLSVEELGPRPTSDAARLAMSELKRALKQLEVREHLEPIASRRKADPSKPLQFRLYLHHAFVAPAEY